MTTPPESDILTARLAELEAENSRLRAVDASPATPASRGSRWRAFISAFCIVLAAFLAPVSVIAGWARAELVDEARFVATFAPLADSPEVQDLIVDQVSIAIEESVDLEGITDSLFDGLAAVQMPPRALDALELLRAPAREGLFTLVENTTTRLVESESFAQVWETALVSSHRALVATAAGGTAGGGVQINDSGELGIQLGPIVEAVKTRLVDQGVDFARAIPPVTKTIVVAQSDALVTIGVVYQVAVLAGVWLPVLSLALLAIGILVARRKSTAILGAGIGLIVGGSVLGIALSVGGAALGMTAANLNVSAAALASVYSQVVSGIADATLAMTTLGIVLAMLAWFQGRWMPAAAARSALASVNSSIRRTLARHRVSTGAFGSWMYHQRVLMRVITTAGAIGVLLLVRPLSVAEIAVTVSGALLVWWLTELLQVRVEEQPVEERAAYDVSEQGEPAHVEPAQDYPATKAPEQASADSHARAQG